MPSTRAFLAGGVTFVLVLLSSAGAALAFEVEPHPGSDVTGGLAGFPARQLVAAGPGEVDQARIGFQNRTGERHRFELSVVDIAGAQKGEAILELVDDAPFGASSWVELERSSFTLDHGDVAYLRVTTRVPRDATPGSYYAAVKAAVADTEPPKGQSAAVVQAAVAVQLFVDIPGARTYRGRISDAETPFLFQRDRGSFLTGRVEYENQGNATDEVGGKVVMRNMLGDKVAELPLKRAIVLRGGRREFRYVWTDTPWIGRFEPTVQMSGDSGEVVKRRLDAIWVVPSWKFWVLLAVTLAIPLWYRRRERRRYRELVEQLQQRPGGSDGEEDDDFWEDDWEEPDDSRESLR